MDPRVFRGQSGVNLGSFRGHFGVIPGSFPIGRIETHHYHYQKSGGGVQPRIALVMVIGVTGEGGEGVRRLGNDYYPIQAKLYRELGKTVKE